MESRVLGGGWGKTIGGNFFSFLLQFPTPFTLPQSSKHSLLYSTTSISFSLLQKLDFSTTFTLFGHENRLSASPQDLNASAWDKDLPNGAELGLKHSLDGQDFPPPNNTCVCTYDLTAVGFRSNQYAKHLCSALNTDSRLVRRLAQGLH